MKISRRIILIALVLNCLIFVIPKLETSAQAVPPSQVVDYLKQKIKVFYIPTSALTIIPGGSIHEISTSAIQNNTDGVLFGQGGNNRMSNSARLLLSLFKNRQGAGNGALQDWLYNLLKIKDKTVNIYFVNDAMRPLSDIVAERYILDTIREDGGLRVWPGTWGPLNNQEAGSINLGEFHFSSSLNVLQLTLLELVTSLQLDSYRTLHPNGGFSFLVPTLENTRFYCFTAIMDQRFVIDQGVCHAISSTYDTTYEKFLYKWFVRPSLVLQRQPDPGTFTRSNAQYWLYEPSGFPHLESSLVPIPESALRSSSSRSSNYGWLNFSSLSSRESNVGNYKLRNEISQALIYNSFIRIGSLHKFLEAVKLTTQQYNTEGSRSKFTLMLENMCRIAMGNSTPAQLASNPQTDKSYLVAIAMVHLLTHKNSEFDYEKFTNSIGAGFPVEIFNLYTNEIKQAVDAIQIPPNNDEAFHYVMYELKAILNPN